MHQNLEALKMIVPSTLTYLKSFESREVFVREGDAWGQDNDASTETIERQCNQWVRETDALIVNLGPMHIHEYDDDSRKEIVRTVVVSYAASVEEGNRDDVGQKEGRKPANSEARKVEKVERPAKLDGVSSALALSDGASSASTGGSLRVPSVG